MHVYICVCYSYQQALEATSIGLGKLAAFGVLTDR